jgi:hypothetical protein
MFKARKIGFKTEPSQLVMDYIVVATGKARRRIMPVLDLQPTSECVANIIVFYYYVVLILLIDY